MMTRYDEQGVDQENDRRNLAASTIASETRRV